jgi:hypothetical protein
MTSEQVVIRQQSAPRVANHKVAKTKFKNYRHQQPYTTDDPSLSRRFDTPQAMHEHNEKSAQDNCSDCRYLMGSQLGNEPAVCVFSNDSIENCDDCQGNPGDRILQCHQLSLPNYS